MKLVDMLGLKPRPLTGPGSTPGTGRIGRFFIPCQSIYYGNVEPKIYLKCVYVRYTLF